MKTFVSLLVIGFVTVTIFGIINQSKVSQLELQLQDAYAQVRLVNEKLENAQRQGNWQATPTTNNISNTNSNASTPSSPCENIERNTSTTQTLESLQNENLSKVVDDKYNVLFPELSLSDADQNRLRQLLLDRERVLSASTSNYFSDDLDAGAAVANQQQLLSELDNEIEGVLGKAEFERYQMVKDSGFEQYQIRQLDNILATEDLLSEDQSREILFIKLKHKNDYTQATAHGNALLQEGKREEALKTFEDAVNTYKTNYLQDARLILNDIQYGELRVYEEQQALQIIDSLRAAHAD